MATSSAWAFFTPEQLATATECPLPNVKKIWPRVSEQLNLCDINTLPVQIGVIGTIARETASSFLPVREGFFLGEPEPAESYRRTLSYYPYYGRGLIQRTHEKGYREAGKKVAALWKASTNDPTFDFIANPDNLLDPDVSAADTALYFRDVRALPTPAWPNGYSLIDACNLNDDEWIRKLVLGGPDPEGEARLRKIRSILTGSKPEKLVYNPQQPPERQIQNWVCAIRVTTWMLKSLGVNIDAGTLQDEMVPGTVSRELGLLDARGYGIASTLGRHLPSHAKIEVLETVTWQQLRDRAGRGPIGLGSHDPRLYHWFNVAEILDNNNFRAPNPAPNYPQAMALGDVLSKEEFDTYAGTWSAVFVEVTSTVPSVPEIPRLPDLATLVGVAYHEDGVLIPALTNAAKQATTEQIRHEIQSVINFLRATNPHRGIGL